MSDYKLITPVTVFYFSLVFVSLIIQHGASVSFDFNFSDPDFTTNYSMISFEGDSSNTTDSISLTSAKQGQVSQGRAMYVQPVLLWDEHTGEVANFTTKFSFLIKNLSATAGDGFAFFLSPYRSIPPNSAGKYLSLFNSTSDRNPSANQVLAVEFDTYLNSIDPTPPNSYNKCHVGIDINTINSARYLFIENSLFLNNPMTAQIEYNSEQKLLSVHLWLDIDPKTTYKLNSTVHIKTILPSTCAFGFSAATGASSELHEIFSWSFSSTLEVKKNSHGLSAPIIGGVVTGAIIIICFFGILIFYLRRKWSIKNRGEKEAIDDIDYEFEKGRGPRKFPYSELVDATSGFAESKKLGEGGFGSVYEGTLKDENIPVAVKRVSKESKQGKKEYISEVKAISRLRHRNLVQLIGWCHDHGEFLLVYELMCNGSLDKHLYSTDSLLTWSVRHSIALGLGSGLLYLHEEWEQCVVHRDIKPSNIMLDSSFNAKLGDFGLARLIEHSQDTKTTIVAGTKGYMAPECYLGTANASTQSDVFSFGVVLLEITCGRRPIVQQRDQKKVSLVSWVWDLYGRNNLIEAVDDRLNGEFEKDEAERLMVVGLWCAHPEKSLRPSIKQAMSALQFQAGLPTLPPILPMPVYYYSPMDPNVQLHTSSGTTSSSGAATSTKSAPVVPSDSSWLLNQKQNTI